MIVASVANASNCIVQAGSLEADPRSEAQFGNPAHAILRHVHTNNMRPPRKERSLKPLKSQNSDNVVTSGNYKPLGMERVSEGQA